jgi:hypothetical protein
MNKWKSRANQLLNPFARGKRWFGQKGIELGAYSIPLLKALSQIPMKKGGRVRGVGEATHGYGKAMRKK